MSHRVTVCFASAALALGAAQSTHAHHVMDYRMPATLMEGLLSGLGHPVIGLDHLLFIVGAGVLAAQVDRGYRLALLFVIASMFAAGTRVAGASWEMSELWIAGSLVALGGIGLAVRQPAPSLVAGFFTLAGLLHGYALAAAIVGAEPTPLYAYFAGLTVIQCAIALAAWGAARLLAVRSPQFPLQRVTGAAVAVAGLYFVGTIVLG